MDWDLSWSRTLSTLPWVQPGSGRGVSETTVFCTYSLFRSSPAPSRGSSLTWCPTLSLPLVGSAPESAVRTFTLDSRTLKGCTDFALGEGYRDRHVRRTSLVVCRQEVLTKDVYRGRHFGTLRDPGVWVRLRSSRTDLGTTGRRPTGAPTFPLQMYRPHPRGGTRSWHPLV